MSGPLRVLAMLTDAYDAGGGIAQYNRDWLSAVAATGALVEVCAFGDCERQTSAIPAGVTVRCATRSRGAFALHALKAAWSSTPHLVWCGHLHLAPLAALAASLARVPLWLQVHGIDAWERPSRLRRMASERALLVSAVSRYTRRRVLTWLSGDSSRVCVLPNTVGDGFTPADKDPALASRLGIDSRPVILTVGRLAAAEAYKGHDRIIACMPELLLRFPELRYVVVGDGDDRQRLQDVAQRFGVSSHLRFVGTLAGGDLIAAYRLADAYVMPSTGEGFGIAFLEAMASGVPALGLDGDGSVDPLADGELGESVSLAALTAGVQRLLEGGRDHGPSLAARVHARFGRSHFDAQVRRLLDRAIGLGA